ncbi:phosphate ABC transporter substrate-binding protein PstS, partial [Streptomyces sp. NPDC004726]
MAHYRQTPRKQLFNAGGTAAGLLLLTACGLGASEDDPAPERTAADRIVCAERGQLAASGSTAQENAMRYWMEEYQQVCQGVKIRYVPIGSGGGVAQFLRGATVMGGSDSPLTPEEVEISGEVCQGGRAIDLPMVGGPIAIGYNITGVDSLVLDAPTLAKIFDLKITRWDDEAVKRLNPGVQLPPTPIVAVHRSDESGTTQNLNSYLAVAAPRDWPYPKEKAWQARAGHSAAGSSGVASQVSGTEGAIGYFELSFAASERLSTVRLDTGAAEPVAVSSRTASAGIAAARITGRGKDMGLEFDYRTSAPGAYPIVQMTYVIVCDKGTTAEALPALKSFLSYTASAEGQSALAGLHYAALPDEMGAQVRTVVDSL